MAAPYDDVRPIIVAEHASDRYGGEAFLPLQYFRRLRVRGVEAWLIGHERTREELNDTLGPDRDRVFYVRDLWIHKAASQVEERFSASVLGTFAGVLSGLITQALQIVPARALAARIGATVIHQPTPVSPAIPSLLVHTGAPVVIGPMNGGMACPPAFANYENALERGVRALARYLAPAAGIALPGKRKAAALLVANERTRRALPAGSSLRVLMITENGVDLTVFRRSAGVVDPAPRPRFVYVGRLVRWKAVDLLLRAVARAREGADLELGIVGDGAERGRLERLVDQLELRDRVRFHGFLPQLECASLLARATGLVLPSLRECGGAVVLEGMAAGLPVIATRWGGPADYLDDRTGILIDPTNPEQFVSDLATGLVRLASTPSLRVRMGAAARARVEERFDWEQKIDRIIEVYREVQMNALRVSSAAPTS